MSGRGAFRETLLLDSLREEKGCDPRGCPPPGARLLVHGNAMEKGCERATERPRLPPRGGAWKRAATPRESGHPEGRAQGTPSPAQACEYELHGQRPRQAPHRSTPPHSLHSRRCCSTRHAFAKSQHTLSLSRTSASGRSLCALLAAACATRRVAHRVHLTALHHQSPTLQSLRPLS